MKKLFYILLLPLLFACGGGNPVIGTWQLDSVSGEELSEAEKSMTITFNEDGSMEMNRGDEIRKGTWELSEDKKTLVMKRDNGREEKGENLSVEGDKMTFQTDRDVITLKKKN